MNDIARYNFRESEAKWQKRWQDARVFETKEMGGKPK